MLNQTYIDKINACTQAIHKLNCNSDDIPAKYDAQYFRNSKISKKDCFYQIINKDITEKMKIFLDERCNLTHFKDSRQGYEYAIDLVLGWLIEDAFLLKIERMEINAVLSGHDRFREFLSSREISTQPDIKIHTSQGDRLLEIFCDWKSTWSKQNHADLRDSKFLKLKREHALMIGLDAFKEIGFLFDFSTGDCGFVENFIPAYRKMGYSNKNIRSSLVPFEEAFDNLILLIK